MTECANRLVVLLFPLCGLGLLTGGLLLRRRLVDRVRTYRAVAGAVVDNAEGSSGGLDGDTFYHPVVEYYVDGRRFTVGGGVGHGKRKRVGQILVVLYAPQNPAESVVQYTYYFLANQLLMLGGVFVAGSLFGAYVFLTDRLR